MDQGSLQGPSETWHESYSAGVPRDNCRLQKGILANSSGWAERDFFIPPNMENGVSSSNREEKMIQDLTESEKKRIDAFHKRGLEFSDIAAEIVVGRHLMDFIHLQGEIERYIEKLEK
jgi:hypothetical protein